MQAQNRRQVVRAAAEIRSSRPHRASSSLSFFRDWANEVLLRILGIVLAVAALLRPAVADESVVAPQARQRAQEILAATGIKGGLIVQLGCGDGDLTAALATDERYLVHGLEGDESNVAKVRAHLQSLDLYGRASVERWSGPGLPYVDNLANVVVSEHPGQIAREEVMRVLAPGGVAYLKSDDRWEKTVKPRPNEIDEWTHFLHDAGNNAVAADTRVGPPRSLQWLAPPLWLRSHETPSGVQAMVCGGGRLVYILDEGLIGITDQRLPERWALLCRDAFNGKLLWRRPLGAWGWPEWAAGKFQNQDWTTIVGGRTAVPNENQRRLVIDGDRIYATLAYRAPLAILDAATGQTVGSVAETAPARQIVAAAGIAVVYSLAADSSSFFGGGKGKRQQPLQEGAGGGTLTAVEGTSGAVLWRKKVPRLMDLSLAIDQGRVVYGSPKGLAAVELRSGKDLWTADPQGNAAGTLVAHDGAVVLRGPRTVDVLDAASGKRLWQKEITRTMGLSNDQDLFVVDGVVWPGIISVDTDQKPNGKGVNALAIGYDLRSGAERKRIYVPDLLSPEHHHRCYRNKATERYMIGSMEGAEFLDLQGDDHCQNNFVRGVCRLGMMPCNGMLYVPPDQCFCQPGAKFLGLKAIGPAPAEPLRPVADPQRLDCGPAYEAAAAAPSALGLTPSDDWPTYRHDAARHASTPAAVGSNLTDGWRATLGGGLTAPVAAGGRVYVASAETHTLHVLDLASGRPLWSFIAGGRIDSPPTLLGGLVLFGSADGHVYCLRASDGALAWQFLAAPCDRRIVSFDQIESVWPVHGSVLVREGVAYVAAGRSTYLDGGIYLYGLDPTSGRIVSRGVLSGPFPDGGKTVARDVSFFIPGANSDVLVSEGDAIYMRQKRLTPALQEVHAEVLSSKGEADVGRHVFSTAGLLDGAWYNRTFWMYARRWPGFQLANQAPKSGQLLVVDGQNSYAVQPFYRRNVHSPMFFPGKEGYLLFADRNDNEPQIVGDKAARKPVAWLPQSDYLASSGLRTLDSVAFGLDKMIGYTRAEPPLWTLWLPVRVRAMVEAGDTLFAAGPPDVFDAKDPYAAFENRKGASLVAVSAKDGKKLTERPLDAPPVFDGMIAVGGRLLVSLEDGNVVCLTGK